MLGDVDYILCTAELKVISKSLQHLLAKLNKNPTACLFLKDIYKNIKMLDVIVESLHKKEIEDAE